MKFNKMFVAPLLIFISISMLIILCGAAIYHYQSRQIKKEKQNELHTIAEIKVIQLSNWLNERMNDAGMISSSPLLKSFLSQWKKKPNDRKLEQTIIRRISTWHRQGTYHTAVLLDTKGNILMADHRDIADPGQATKDLVKQTAALKKAVFSDFYYCDYCKAIHLDVVLPVFDPDPASRNAIAVMILRIDPEFFLYPYLQLWPTFSKTAETALLRRDGDEMVFLNNLRFNKDAALKTRFKINTKTPDLAKSIEAGDGMVEDVDYRQVKVLACIMKVPNTPWYLLTKIDTEEAYAPLRRVRLVLAFAAAFLILLTAVLILAVMAVQRRDYYKKLYQAELERAALLKHFDHIVKYANDIIILHDDNFDIIEANDRALQSYGYSKGEIIGMNIGKIMARENQQQMKQRIDGLDEDKGVIFETVHRNKSNKDFPVEVSLRRITIEGKNYYQGIVRDIAERKRSHEMLQRRQDALDAVYHISTSLGETFQNICDRVATDLAKILSAPHLAVQTIKDGKINVISFLSEGRMENNLEASLEGTPCEIVYQKGEPLEINTSLRKLFPTLPLSKQHDLNAYLGVPFKDRNGKVLGLVCVYDYQARIFSREELHLLDIFAHYLGYEMERIDLESKIRETEKIKVLSSIASGVAHEVRNPLHAIQAISEAMARETEERPEYKEYLDHIRTQVNRLSQLMKELLELGKPIQPATFKRESLKELTETAVKYWKDAQGEPQYQVQIDNQLKPGSSILADSDKLQEVIINLLDNAVQHGPGSKEIKIELLPDGKNQAKVKVVDRGSGIKTQDLPRMFEPFYTTRKKGTGLGLTLCKRIIESHEGTIEIRNNQDGPGCTAQFTMPLYGGE